MIYTAYFEVEIEAADGLTDWDVERLAVKKIKTSFMRAWGENNSPEYECKISPE